MATAKTEETQSTIDELFATASSDPNAIEAVSKYVKTGKRWDLKHNEVMDKLLVLRRAKKINTKYGEAQLVEVDIEGLEKSVLFGGQVLIDQIEELGPNFPVLAVVIKPGRSYTLSDPTPDQIQEYIKKYRS